MTNSRVEAAAGKRERLVEGATALFHEQGVHRTTLADVAERSDVPIGNVYYYFKTKDELVGAVVDHHREQARTVLASLERHRTPRARLKALARLWVEQSERVARHGCPIGSLCSELDKLGEGLDEQGAGVLRLIVDWAEAQFHELGRRDARDLALGLLGGIQGASLLANTFREPEILAREARRIDRWVDSL
jgi:AcrR family transcriptional regulator